MLQYILFILLVFMFCLYYVVLTMCIVCLHVRCENGKRNFVKREDSLIGKYLVVNTLTCLIIVSNEPLTVSERRKCF